MESVTTRQLWVYRQLRDYFDSKQRRNQVLRCSASVKIIAAAKHKRLAKLTWFFVVEHHAQVILKYWRNSDKLICESSLHDYFHPLRCATECSSSRNFSNSCWCPAFRFSLSTRFDELSVLKTYGSSFAAHFVYSQTSSGVNDFAKFGEDSRSDTLHFFIRAPKLFKNKQMNCKNKPRK